MTTQQSAKILITNATNGNADVILFHTNRSNGSQRGEWQAQPGQTVGPMVVYFETGFGTGEILDYWSVLVHVKDGPSAGFYINSGSSVEDYWKECQLQHADASKTITLSVSASTFNIALKSGGCDNGMTKLAPSAPITHVFVLMLENHSFDNIFAMSELSGVKVATLDDYNTYNNERYYVQNSAPLSLPTDPGHEFADVVQQLTGLTTSLPYGASYPPINNSGFVSSYATSTSESPNPPHPDQVIDIMSCFDTRYQLPAIYNLAAQFAICDHWYSSMPGPTWPNRFFLHGASSSGFDDSPTTAQMAGWEINGFKYPNGSIFQRLKGANIPYRIYHDAQANGLSLYSDAPNNGSRLGAIPQVSALSGVSMLDVNSLASLSNDLQGPYPYCYTFIEPHYGNLANGTYAGGSSQHPMDDVYGGEHMLNAVYSAIRSSPYWNTSLLLVIYDEHGGFYDSVTPGEIPAPADNPAYGYNTHGFNFTTAGVRVPAVIASPLIAPGTVDSTPYDHASVPALLERLWGLPPLTQRDAQANTPLHLLSLPTPRETLTALPTPLPSLKGSRAPLTPTEEAAILSTPVPDSGNLAGALAILRKTDTELSAAGFPPAPLAVPLRANAALSRIDAERYAASVLERVRLARAQRQLAKNSGGNP
nr:alkaline phosphatase family protein [Pseudomonas caspiana]